MTSALRQETLPLRDAKKRVTVLGSTGSIGKSTLDVIAAHPERFTVDALTAQKNVDTLVSQAIQHRARLAVIGDEALYGTLKDRLAGSGIEAAAGPAAIADAAARPVDIVMAAIVGAAGIAPTLAAIAAAPTVAIANKESVVCAGNILFDSARRHGTHILPVDSEHNALFQLMDLEKGAEPERVYLTASGGPFLKLPRSALKDVTPEMALRHPTWSMGAKISIDSATMVNKSLEIIEAAYLFNLKHEKISAIIHPQSIVHALVEYKDGSILSHMGAPDMRTAISYTLGWPERIYSAGKKMSFLNAINLSFEMLDENRFPAVRLARLCLDRGGAATAVFSTANEVAVAAFLAGSLRFDLIETVCEQAVNAYPGASPQSLHDVLDLVECSAALAADIVKRLN
jgi:1-deoxy-D-xylulose-5-phosphate reductoisomerase